MWIVIDGYNLIRRSPLLAPLDRRDLGEGREALLAALVIYRRLKGHRITLVFDGRERGGVSVQVAPVAGVQVVFSSRGERADEVILRLVQKAPGGSVVVTSDRALALAFKLQRDTGTWGSLDCWPPYESSAYHLATVAAMAAGTAPGWPSSRTTI